MTMSLLRHSERRIKPRRAPSRGPTELGPSGRLVLDPIFTAVKLKHCFADSLLLTKTWYWQLKQLQTTDLV